MKVRRARVHVAQNVQYESITLAAHVEIDTEIDTEFVDLSAEEIGEELDQVLDDLLRPEVDRTLRAGGNQIEQSHLWDYYDYE